MKVLVVGGGGREHAIVWKLKQSPRVSRIYCAPGNGGISDLADCVDITATDIGRMVAFAKAEHIDLVFVAPDDPLAQGMVDAMELAGLRAFGPRKAAAAIEGSKVFAKDLMRKYNIPTAGYSVFDDAEKAKTHIKTHGAPIVVKADGLALGKGVVVAMTVEEACAAVDQIMVQRTFGEAGTRVVIEEYISGPEVSVMCFTDGNTIVPMLPAQDHKRVGDGDKGPNTGGMGAFAPSPKYTPEIAEEVYRTILVPTIRAMEAEGRLFKGILYMGLMLTDKGVRVLEYNARFGDPETQVILPLLENDLVEIIDAILDGNLDRVNIRWKPGAAVTVVMASGGYPGDYAKNLPITGIGEAEKQPGVMVFHAGTAYKQGQYYTQGGRVLGVTAIADTMQDAIDRAYAGVEKIGYNGAHWRKDIGMK